MSKSIILTDNEARCKDLRYVIWPCKDAPDNATSCLKAPDPSGDVKFFSSPLPGIRLAVSGWIKSPWQPGEKLAVRESWAEECILGRWTGKYLYKSRDSEITEEYRSDWRSPATMPLAYARRWLIVESVECKRVEEVTDDEAKGSGSHPRTYRDEREYEPATIEFKELWRKRYSSQWAWIVRVREVR